MCIFLSLPTPPGPNISTKFRIINISRPPLLNSLSPFRLTTLTKLLCNYPELLQIHFPIILCFEIKLGYQSSPNTYILSKNLASALKNSAIIEKKLIEDLVLGKLMEVVKPISPFISSPLGLVPKHDRGWKKIYHFLYLLG